MPTPTTHLVKGCVSGDRRSQQELFGIYRDRVFALVYRSLGQSFDIDDVTQQVFIRLFRSLEHYQELSSLDTWVYRITGKVCTDQLRKKYRKRKLETVFAGEDVGERSANPPGDDAASQMERRELNGKISEALDRLSPEKRLVVVLFEMEEKCLEEIARITQVPVGTVKSRLFHARREMENHLRRYLLDG